MTSPSQDSRPPRGALIVVAVGLFACVVAALLSTDKASGEAAELEWVQKVPMADSRPTSLPGGSAMRLVDGSIRTTGLNVSGYSLFWVSSRLRIDAGAPVGGGRILCSTSGSGRAEIAQSAGDLRATYPRSSTGLFNQEVPEVILLDFSSHGSELAVLEVLEEPSRFTTAQGVKLEWPEYEEGTENLKYFLTDKPEAVFKLPFFTVWKSTSAPSAKVSCELETSAGKATVRTAGSLPHVSPPIDEEAEEEKTEEKEEREEEKDSEEEGG
ncbi:MAG TPA: hypothetical protein VIY71_08800 [Solirubrobacterales bacterium]